MNRLQPRLLPVGMVMFPVVMALGLGFEGWRLAQMGVLALSAWVWLLWPARHRWVRLLQAGMAGLFGLAFLLDAGVRLYLRHSYDASPASAMVMAAVANTHWHEGAEYLQMQGPRLLLAVSGLGGGLACLLAGLWFWWRLEPAAAGRPSRVWALGVLLCLVLPLASKQWRQLHPLVFWTHWSQSVTGLHQQWSELGASRQALMQRAQEQAPRADAASPQTVVLVLSESINRKHLSIYGYLRPTSPQLALKKNLEADRLRVFEHAWSVDASTVPALRNFFYFGDAQGRRQHLLSLAAAAGYQTWWISNQDDVAIEQEHARLAGQVHLLNKQPGRGSRSLDQHSLPVLEQALRGAAPRKLIVLHLIGAHPDYRLRYGQDAGRFKGVQDEIYQELKAQGRSKWVRELRNDYDSALHYHDAVVTDTLALTRKLGGRAAWMFFSDHGQDVGSSGNRAGHSSQSVEGYRIPLLIWGQGVQALPQQVDTRQVRSDWLAHSMMNLLDIDWPGHRPDRDVLDPAYRWVAPALPASVQPLR